MSTTTATRWQDIATIVRTLLVSTHHTQAELAQAIGAGDASAISRALGLVRQAVSLDPPPPGSVPPRPPRKSRSPWNTLLLVGVAVVAVGYVAGQLGLTGDDESDSGSSCSLVTYQVHGTARRASLTISNTTGDSEQFTVNVPWDRRIGCMPDGSFLYVSAQNDTDSGSVSCEIVVDGVAVKTATSAGAYVIASCSGRL